MSISLSTIFCSVCLHWGSGFCTDWRHSTCSWGNVAHTQSFSGSSVPGSRWLGSNGPRLFCWIVELTFPTLPFPLEAISLFHPSTFLGGSPFFYLLHFSSRWTSLFLSVHFSCWTSLSFSTPSTFVGGPPFFIPPPFYSWISFFPIASLFLVMHLFLCAISSICEVEKGKICVVVTEKSCFLFSVTVSQPRHYGISVIRIFHDCDYNSCVLWAVCGPVWYAQRVINHRGGIIRWKFCSMTSVQKYGNWRVGCY